MSKGLGRISVSRKSGKERFYDGKLQPILLCWISGNGVRLTLSTIQPEESSRNIWSQRPLAFLQKEFAKDGSHGIFRQAMGYESRSSPPPSYKVGIRTSFQKFSL